MTSGTGKTSPSVRKKFGSSRRAIWLSRRRSRSLDSSSFLCDYTSLQRSSKLLPRYSLLEVDSEEQSNASDDYIYEEACQVELVRGVSLVDETVESEADERRHSLQRNCKSLNDVDYENVTLQNPSHQNSVLYENVRLQEGRASLVYSRDSQYDEPWQTVDALQMLLEEHVLDLAASSRLLKEKEIDDGEHASIQEYDIGTVQRGPTFSVDTTLPLLHQCWYHDELCRSDAEHILLKKPVGAFLVRRNSLHRKDLTLSVRTTDGVVHIIAVRQKDCRYILGQFSEPFESAAAMIEYYHLNPLRIHGADHTILTFPVHCASHDITN